MPRIDWRHAFLLSLLGLVDAGLTVFTTMASSFEPFVWLGIYVVWYVLLIRKRPVAPVAQALATSLLSAVWVAVGEAVFFDTYAANHPDLVAGLGNVTRFQRIAGFAITPFVFGITLGLFLGFMVRWQLMRTASEPVT